MTKNISSAFVKAQKAFGPALKTKANGAFKGSTYAPLDACIDAVMPALNEHGIAVIQKTHECEDGVAVETIFLHESGETLSSGIIRVPASKHDAHGYGSAMTYARRYSLMAACGIAPEDDDGNSAVKTQYVTDMQVQELEELITKTGSNKSKFLQFLRVNSLSALPATAFYGAKKSLEAKLPKVAA